jgi:hypothetical protein
LTIVTDCYLINISVIVELVLPYIELDRSIWLILINATSLLK